MKKVMSILVAVLIFTIIGTGKVVLANETVSGIFNVPSVVPAGITTAGEACVSENAKLTPTSYKSAVTLNKRCSSTKNITVLYGYTPDGTLILDVPTSNGTKLVLVYQGSTQNQNNTALQTLQANTQTILNNQIASNNANAAVNACLPEVDKWNQEVMQCRQQYYMASRYIQNDKDQYSNKDMTEYQDYRMLAGSCCGAVLDPYATCRENINFTASRTKRPDGPLCKVTNFVQTKVLDKTIGKVVDLVLVGY